jgi:dipeptidyl aminopeptidase/acylaminoacyl peptidase
MSLRFALLVFGFSLLSAQALQPSRGWLTVDTIMRDPAWMGTAPSNPAWSEDSKSIYFNWRQKEDKGDSLYVVSAAAGTPRKVTAQERKSMPARFGHYTRDYSKKLYVKEGDIFLFDIKGGKETQLTSTITAETNPRFLLDEKRIWFVRENNLFVRNLESGAETQITNLRSGQAPKDPAKTDEQKFLEKQQMELFDVLRERKEERELAKKFRESLELKRPKPFYTGTKSVDDLQLSPDGTIATFSLSQQGADAKRTIVPSYVTESGFTEDINARTKVGEPLGTEELFVYNPALDSVMQVKPDDVEGIVSPKVANDTTKSKPKARGVWYSGPFWSDDGMRSFVQLVSQDNKDRWLVMIDAEKAKFTTLLDRQHDDAWVQEFGLSLGWMPDNKRIHFQSEESGWMHLYVVDADGKNKRALTSGKFEVYSPQISREKNRWYFHSNEVHFGERHAYSMPLEGGPRTRLTSVEGWNDTRLSPDESKFAILFSFSNRYPELHIGKNSAGTKVVQVTNSRSDEFKAYDWRAPEISTFKARDGADVPYRLFKPERPNGAAVVFVHGAGYLQEVTKGWSYYFREFMFNNLLCDKGYTVIEIDYRASAGLGRDWRTGIYRFMGGKDLEDNVDAVQWLVKNHGVDSKRVGLYGGSYGGFIALMGLFTTPDVFAAGAALRPVTDWAHYNHGYTSNILNIPQEDTIAYRRSSPIYHAAGLKGALLICHGMVDVNVHFQDAVRLAQRLIELKKENWELAVYPLEDHGFVEPTSWRDEYSRVLKLFERNIR